MFGRKKKHDLYYLLPGMSRANRQKRKTIFYWSLLIGILASALLGGAIWLINSSPRP